MNRIKVLLAALVLLPMLAFGTSVESAVLGNAPDGSAPSELEGSTSYECCWVFFAGRWWCVPCGI